MTAPRDDAEKPNTDASCNSAGPHAWHSVRVVTALDHFLQFKTVSQTEEPCNAFIFCHSVSPVPLLLHTRGVAGARLRPACFRSRRWVHHVSRHAVPGARFTSP